MSKINNYDDDEDERNFDINHHFRKVQEEKNHLLQQAIDFVQSNNELLQVNSQRSRTPSRYNEKFKYMDTDRTPNRQKNNVKSNQNNSGVSVNFIEEFYKKNEMSRGQFNQNQNEADFKQHPDENDKMRYTSPYS
jgi:hypothetical protein